MPRFIDKNKNSYISEYYSMHVKELRCYVQGRIGDDMEAEDIVQNAFMRALTSTKMITPVTLPAFMYTIVRNLIYDYWRHHKAINEYEHMVTNGLSSHSNGLDDPESYYNVQDILHQLEDGITHLSDKKQKIYRLNIYEGKAVSEISKELCLNYKFVENRLTEARREIRGMLRKRWA